MSKLTIKHHPTHLFLQSLQENCPSAYLSGSLALQMNGYKSAKEANDIDVYIESPSGDKPNNVIKLAALAIYLKLDKDVFISLTELVRDDEYLDDEFFRVSYSFKFKDGNLTKDIKVDFFCAVVSYEFVEYLTDDAEMSSYKIEDGEEFCVRALNSVNIIKFKVQHAMNNEGHWSERKQAADLVRFFSNLI